MLQILKACDCCRLGLIDDDKNAYIVPLNFGYEIQNDRLLLYFHGALQGKKYELIHRQNTASFEMDRAHALIKGEQACAYSCLYQSIMGKGTIRIVEEYAEKVHGLRTVMSHYSDRNDWLFKEELINGVSVIRLEVTEWSCKEHA